MDNLDTKVKNASVLPLYIGDEDTTSEVLAATALGKFENNFPSTITLTSFKPDGTEDSAVYERIKASDDDIINFLFSGGTICETMR